MVVVVGGGDDGNQGGVGDGVEDVFVRFSPGYFITQNKHDCRCFQMQRLVDPIRYMSFRNISWEVIHEVKWRDHYTWHHIKYVHGFVV